MIGEMKEEPRKWMPDSQFPWKESKFIFQEGTTFQYWVRFDPEKGTPNNPGVAEFVFLIPRKWFKPDSLQRMLQGPFPILQVVEDRPNDLMYRLNMYSPTLAPERNRNMELPNETTILGYFSKFVRENVDALPN